MGSVRAKIRGIMDNGCKALRKGMQGPVVVLRVAGDDARALVESASRDVGDARPGPAAAPVDAAGREEAGGGGAAARSWGTRSVGYRRQASAWHSAWRETMRGRW